MKKKIPLLIAAAAVLVLLVWYLPKNDLCSHPDMLAYWSATRVFFSGGNPYDKTALFELQHARCNILDPMLAWNPPILFTTIGLVANWYNDLPAFVFDVLFLVAALCLAYFPFKKTNNSIFNKSAILFLAISAYPLQVQIELGQLSSLLCALVIFGFYYFFQRKFFLAGAFLAFLVIKPHVFVFPCLWILTQVRKQDFLKLAAGGVVSLLMFSLAAEYINPGIHTAWIGRKEWPTAVFGSGLSSALRLLLDKRNAGIGVWFPIISIALGIGVYLLAERSFTSLSAFQKFLLALSLNPFFAPYGFIFDQIILLPVQGYLIYSQQTYQAKRKVLIALSIINILCYALTDISFSADIVVWNLPAICIPLIFIVDCVAKSRIENLNGEILAT